MIKYYFNHCDDAGFRIFLIYYNDRRYEIKIPEYTEFLIIFIKEARKFHIPTASIIAAYYIYNYVNPLVKFQEHILLNNWVATSYKKYNQCILRILDAHTKNTNNS